MTTATPRASVMPFRPPNASPIKRSNSVNAVSKNAVLSVFIARSPGARSGGARLCLLLFEFHFTGLRIGVDQDGIACLDLAVENFERQRILNQPLNGALHGARAVRRVVAFAEEQRLRRGRQRQGDLLFGYALHER